MWQNYLNNSLFQALGQWGRSKKRAGEERDQRRAGSGREKERAGDSVSILFKTLFCPLEKRNHFLCQNVKCQNLRMFGIELLARVSRGQADLHSVLRSSAVVYVCCVSSENLFECRSLCVDVQKINYRQRIRPIRRIETIMKEQSQIKTMAYTTRKTVNRLACKQLHLNHVVLERTKKLQPKHRVRETKAWSNWCKKK